MAREFIEIRNLKTYFYTGDGIIKAVDDVSFKITEAQTVGIVGESGCGKSVTAMSMLRLIPDPPGKIVGGEIIFEGENILSLSEEKIRDIRGNKISVIFQEPMTALNPVFTIGDQILEVITLHQHLNKQEALVKAADILKLVGVPEVERILKCYPHELSGGMRQRMMIAMAVSCNPRLLIADEPTTALDVTIQAQILDLMLDLKKKLNSSIMLITHDLGVVAETCDHVVVMYTGKIIEEADVVELFKNPLHPYTSGLLESKPVLHRDKERLDSIPGQVPDPGNLPEGCHFHPRCSRATDLCKEKRPELTNIGPGHKVACWLHEGGNGNE
jgi:peptide/nickel transport system ATP-binding protein